MSVQPSTEASNSLAGRIDYWRCVVSAAVLVSVIWRFATLANRPIWFDEAFSWQLTRFSWSEMFERIRDDFNPPLYYCVLKLFTTVLGDSLFVLRLPSALCFLAALGGTWLLGRELNRTAQVRPLEPSEILARSDFVQIAVLLVAASSTLIYYSQEIRMYSQMVALALLSSGMLLRAYRERAHPARWWLAYAATATALAYTHTVGLFTIIAQLVFLTIRVFPKGRPTRRWFVEARLGWVILAGTVIGLLFLPWIPTLLAQRRHAAGEYWTEALPAGVWFDPTRWLWPITKLTSLLVFPATLPSQPGLAVIGYLLVGAVLILTLMRWEMGAAYLLTGTLVPFLLLDLVSRQSGREFALDRLFLAPFCLFLMMVALLLTRVQRRNLRMGAALAAAVLLGWYGLGVGTGGRVQRQSYRSAVECVSAEYREGDVIAAGHPFSYLPIKYHARGRFTPRLIPRNEPFKRFEGSVVLCPEDYLPDELLEDSYGHRLLLIGLADSPWTSPKLPNHWTQTNEAHVFLAPVRQHGPVTLTIWQSGNSPRVP